MAITCNCLNNLEASDWIDICGILVNAILGLWIVLTIQNKLTNKRVLKDHFIGEIKDISLEYKDCLERLYSNSLLPSDVIPWFKLMNIKINDLMIFLDNTYKIELDLLQPYQTTLRDLITNNVDYINNYQSNNPIVLSSASKLDFIKFQQDNNKIFNDLIIKINNA